MTVLNTNDVPVITGATNPAALLEVAGDSAAQDLAAVTGTITISDQDLGDALSVSVTGDATATYNGGPVPVEDSVNIAALVASGAISFAPAVSNGESVTLNWTYDPAVADLDWLRDGQSLVLTYVAQVTDGAGNVGSQNLVITITGTNDVPVITGATNPAALLEVAGDSAAQDLAAVTGTITISDQDLGDALSVSVTGNASATYNGGPVPVEDSVSIAALVASGAISFAPAVSNGESVTLNWTYDPAVADLDWLRDGQSLVLTYVAQVTDGAGNVGSQNLVITITGTNDVPVITGATNPAALLEVAGDSAAQDLAAVTGTITISDQDLGDALSVSVTGNASATYNGGPVPVEDSVSIAALVASGAISFAPAVSNGESVTLNWTYDPAVADLDWLRDGQSLVLTYVAQVTDGAGNVGSQNLVITITGTNDVPVITGATNPAALLEVAGDSAAQDLAAVTGTITISDQDLGDALSVSVTGNATATYNGGPVPVEDSVSIAALVASGAISFAPAVSNGESVTLNWTYDPAVADLDWLRDGQSLVLTYVAQVTDGAGNVGSQNLVITITGTNDVPVITGATNPAALLEVAGDSAAQDLAAVTGTITISDQDLGDALSVSVTGNASATYNGGPVPVEDSVSIAALVASGAISFAPAVSNGESVTLNWTYDPAVADLDWLRDGQSLVLTYVAQVTDGAGNVGSQNLVITITGTNDVPVITGATNPAALLEVAGDSAAQDLAAVTGTITISDQDLGDALSVSVTGNASATYNGGPVPVEDSVSIAALVASGAISFAPAVSNGESVTLNWTYDPAVADLDWLRDGQSLVLTYVAQVTDGAGNVGSQNLVITITGTNDVPVITGATNPAALLEVAGDSAAQDLAAVTGTITISDQDLGDALSVSVTGNASATYNGGPVPVEDSVSIAALVASGAISFAPAVSNGESVTLNWTYDPAVADLDWLRDGQSLVLTYVAQVTDGAGNVGSQNLVITITGTNDVPVITGATNPAALLEVAGDSAAQDLAAVTGTITISDQDLGDALSVSVTGNASATYNGGPVPVEDSVSIAALVASGAISFAPAVSNGESVTLNWTYDPAVADLDWLRDGQSLVLTYVAQVTDGAGNVGSQNLVITITGTNDVPVITGATNPAALLEVAGDSAAQDLAAVTGTITISDQDLGDALSVSVTGNATATYNGGPVPVEDSVSIAALVASGAISFAPAVSNGESVTLNWTYDPAVADLDWLRDGQSLVLTYVAQVTDGAGNVGSQNLVITITGTNDVPVITGATNPAALLEVAGDSAAQDLAAVTGTITISDQDLGDALSVSVTGNASATYNGGPVPVEDSVSIAALVASGAISFAPAVSNGESVTLNWTYDPAVADLDWLRDGQSLVLTYVAQVTDGAGNVGSQNLVITITGTNDVPVITGATNPAALLEVAGDSAAQDLAAVTGTITISDQDLGDALSVSVTGNASATYNGGPVPVEDSVSIAALVASGAISFAPAVSNGESVTLNWTYDPAVADLDWLRDGQSLVLTYVAQVTDGAGNVGSQNLVITITGTNDVPVITGATNPAALLEVAGDSAAQDLAAVTGTITISDQDLGDALSVSVTGNASATYNGGPVPVEDSVSIAALVASGAISFAPAVSNGESVTLNWTYDPAVADLDWLRDGQSLVLTYVAQVTDGAGNVGSQNLVITITGTNDVPVITGATNPAALLEVAGDSAAQDLAAVTGTITISDQDLGDALSVSVTGNASATYNGGPVPVEDSVSIAALVASGAISFAPAVSNGESVTLNWTYDPAVADLDWLRDGQSLVLTYVAQVTDGAGNVGSQNLVITITGTNDVPVAVADTNSGDPIIEGFGYGASLIPGDSTALGNVLINDTDQDLGETSSLRVIQISSGGPGFSVAAGSTSTSGATTITGTYGALMIGADGSWSYQLDDADLDTQALIGNGAEVFTYTIVDPQGTTATATLTLTVQGMADGIFTANADTLDLNDFVSMAAGGWDGANNPTLTGTLTALGGNDSITLASTEPGAWSGLTTFSGGEGEDTIHVSAGYIGLDGGNGTDLVDFGDAAEGIIATLDGTYEIGSTGAHALTGFENLNGGAFDDVVTGNGGANVINGDGGDDQIDGGEGDDNLDGGDGSDVILGGIGADVINGGDGDDDITGGTGNDTITAGEGADIIHYQIGLDGQDAVDGGADDDELALTGTTGNQSIIVTVPQVANPMNFNVNVGPPAGNDIIVTSVETLTIDAISGTNDRLQVIGANGGTAADTITATGTLANLTVDVNGGLTINGLNFDRLTLSGSGGNDTLDATGFESSIFLNGNAGQDTLLGGIGDDVISGAAGRDLIEGGEGDDTLNGGNDQDRFVYTFGDGFDAVTGGEGNAATDLDTIEAGGTPVGFGHATVDVTGVEAFDIDLGSDSSTEISATEIEAIELRSSAPVGPHVLTVLGRNVDVDPPGANMPGDERMVVENSGMGGISITLAENGETILAEGFEQLVLDGRQGDDEIDLQGLLVAGNGLDAAIASATILGGAGSDRFIAGEETRTLTIVGGETSDSDFAGDTVYIVQGGDTRITLRDNDSFAIDYTRDAAADIEATEVERVEAEGTSAAGEVLLVQGRDEDTDPFFPQDERITVTSDLIAGFALHFAENGETISGIEFERLVIEGRDGDDVIDVSGLAAADPTGLDAAIGAVRLLGGSGSDRFVTSRASQAAIIIGGETGDADFGGDVVELLDAGSVTVTYNDAEDFSIDHGSNGSIEIAATEIERIEARGTTAAGEVLLIQGRNADIDPFFPQDERIIVESDPIAGFAATLAENGEVIAGIDFEQLVIEGRDGDDVIEVSLLAAGPDSGLDAGVAALVLNGGDGSDRFAFSTTSHAATVIGGETGDASFGGDAIAIEIEGAADIVIAMRADESFAIDFENDSQVDIDVVEIERIEISAMGGNLTILGAGASGVLSGDEVITLSDDGLSGFVATYQNNGEAVAGQDVGRLTIDARGGDDIIDVSQVTTASGIVDLIIDTAGGNDSVSLGIGGVRTEIRSFEVGNAAGGDTLDLEALFNAGFAATDITVSNGVDSELLEDLLNGVSTTDFGSGFRVILDTGSGQIDVAEVGLVGSSPSVLDIMNIAFDGQRTIHV